MAGRHKDATVSREEFQECCLSYLDKRARDHGLEVGWTWQAGLLPGTGYLHRRWELLWQRGEDAAWPAWQCAPLPDVDSETEGARSYATDGWGVGEEHGAPAGAGASGNSVPLTIDQSVCWSPIWHVPVLYFTVVYQDGTPLSLSSLYASPVLHSEALDSESIRGGMPALVNGEHPETGAPCWSLHPCETHTALEELVRARTGGACEYMAGFMALLSSAVAMSPA